MPLMRHRSPFARHQAAACYLEPNFWFAQSGVRGCDGNGDRPMNLTRTKTIEQSIADTEEPEHQLQRAVFPPADGVRRRRDHRYRHLRADGRGRRGEGRACRRALVPIRRHRLRADYALLRGIREHRAGGGLGVHLLLRECGCRLNRPSRPIPNKKSQKGASDVREMGNIQSR
jgi:hypothetical protein